MVMHKKISTGVFNWIERMGAHEAYHQGFLNRLIHWICIPFELFGIIKILSIVTFSIRNIPVDLAFLTILMISPVYLVTEVLAGSLMVLFLLGLWMISQQAFHSVGESLIIGLLATVIGFVIQTKVGHRLCEEGGRDDTERNIEELKRSKNPIPILLIFYYHLLELLFAGGYRPKLKFRVDLYRKKEEMEFQRSMERMDAVPGTHFSDRFLSR